MVLKNNFIKNFDYHRLLYGVNELKSDYCMTYKSQIQNVLKINKIPHCGPSKCTFCHQLKFKGCDGILKFSYEFGSTINQGLK